jgi:hypothetical protein
MESVKWKEGKSSNEIREFTWMREIDDEKTRSGVLADRWNH